MAARAPRGDTEGSGAGLGAGVGGVVVVRYLLEAHKVRPRWVIWVHPEVVRPVVARAVPRETEVYTAALMEAPFRRLRLAVV